MQRFSDKTAWVTGAGSGLGRATAVRLASEGAKVACLDLVEATAAETVAAIVAADGTARAYACDVSNPTSVAAATAQAFADLGRPDVLVNSAGLGRFANAHDMGFEDWSRIIGVNLTGTFLMCQAALRRMLDGGGCIVNVASNAGLMGLPYSAAYCASKGGVVQLTKALADEYLGRGIRVNAVAPGGMMTPLLSSFHNIPEGAEAAKFGKMRTPLGMSEPAEVASLIAFVASHEGRYMTGSIVAIDGGLTV